MITVREIMTGGAECVRANETLEQAARKMKDLDVGSLPICGEDNRLKGMLTDRDIDAGPQTAGHRRPRLGRDSQPGGHRPQLSRGPGW